MAKLTDKQRKKIIAERLEGATMARLAEKYKVSETTIRRVIKSDPKMAEKVAIKKEQNSADIIAHMGTMNARVIQVLDAYLEHLLDPDVIAKATPSQITTAMGTLIDKFTQFGGDAAAQEQQHAALIDAIRKHNGD